LLASTSIDVPGIVTARQSRGRWPEIDTSLKASDNHNASSRQALDLDGNTPCVQKDASKDRWENEGGSFHQT